MPSSEKVEMYRRGELGWSGLAAWENNIIKMQDEQFESVSTEPEQGPVPPLFYAMLSDLREAWGNSDAQQYAATLKALGEIEVR